MPARTMNLLQFPHRTADSAHAATALLPRAPQTVEDTGLALTFLVELLAKSMLQFGLGRLTEMASHLCLSPLVTDAVCQFMRRESLLEVLRRGQTEGR